MKFCLQFSTCIVPNVAFLRPFGRVFHSFFKPEIATALGHLLDFLNRWPRHVPLAPLTLTLINCHTSVWEW